MAIRIENEAGAYDRFQITCSHCGRVISYSRKDIKVHRRWPNGFIYCPACKAPIGHDENNLSAQGADVIEKEMLSEKEQKDRSAIAAQIRAYKVPKIILLSIGIPTLVLGAILTAFCWAPNSEAGMLGMLIPGLFLFSVGLFMVIFGGAFARRIKARQAYLAKKEE